MLKKKTISVFIFALACSLTIAQDKNLVKENWVLPSDQNQAVISQDEYNSPALTPGQELFKTGYDYMTNNAMSPMIDLYDIDGDGILDPLMTGMQRFPDAAGQRTQRFAYIAFGAPPDNFSAFDETNGTSGSNTYGWGTVQACVGGPLDGMALLFAHSNNQTFHSTVDLTTLVPTTPFSTVSLGGNYPTFVYLPDGTIIAGVGHHTANIVNDTFFVSTDQGATFNGIFKLGEGDANFNYSAIPSTGFPSESPMWKSVDGMYLTVAGGYDGAGVGTASPDIVYLYGSTDGGATWFGTIPGVGSGTTPIYGQVVNRNYAPYFTNFGQLNVNVDNTGVTHLVMNGYGEGTLQGSTDTTNVFATLYWNSANQEWISISNPLMDAPGDGFGNFITNTTAPTRTYPGNGIGQAYPNVSTSDDGRVVFVCWQAMEYTGAIGTTAWNMYPGDGGTYTGVIYYTDLYYAYSEDGGATWSDVSILKGDPDVMEMYPYCARTIEYHGDTATVHYVYMEDAIPGIAVFNGQVAGQNSWSNDTRWLYDTMTFQTTVGVKDEIVANNFSLEQNYPNPFNPSTTINYSLAERSAVSLKVYDVLGNEVVKLINTTQEAGKHTINFNASKLSSGLYIYTLNTGNFTSSKKMMLLK